MQKEIFHRPWSPRLRRIFITLAMGWLMVIAVPEANAQEMTVRDYSYRLITTDLSPRQAIQRATREALVACVQENLGTRVMNLTVLEKQEKDRNYQEKFNEYSQQVSYGFIRNYRIKDTISQFEPSTLTLETRITMDITLYNPESDNDLGLMVTTGKTSFGNGEPATIRYSLKKNAYIYIFDLNYRNEYCLIHESPEAVQENIPLVFPEPGMVFELEMVKEDDNDFEFGSFLMVASLKPVNFGVKAATKNNWKFQCLDFNTFFGIISGIKKDHSISYLPYCIENKSNDQ